MTAAREPGGTKAHQITIARVLDAPVALVWQAWTEPERLARWFGPRGMAVPKVEVEPREGGAFRLDMRGPDGTLYSNRGEFLQVVRHEQLVYSDVVDEGEKAWGDAPPPSNVQVITFEDLGGSKTRLTVTVRLATAAERQAMLDLGAVAGWESSLDRLEEHLPLLDRDTLAFVLVRRFRAPRSLVFRAWAEPEHLKRWCAPAGFTVTGGEMEFRPGGGWSSSMRGPAGDVHRLRGVYREIVANERIVFTHAWVNEAGEPSPETLITVTFEDDGAGTKLTFRQEGFESAASRDGHAEGWGETLDSLESHLRNPRRPPEPKEL